MFACRRFVYKRFCMKKGFTLIELLVVVLIIGVLSAVALPQYRKSVFKSQLVQVDTIMDTYKKVVSTHLLANGFGSSVRFTGSKGDADLKISGSAQKDYEECRNGVTWGVSCGSVQCQIVVTLFENAGANGCGGDGAQIGLILRTTDGNTWKSGVSAKNSPEAWKMQLSREWFKERGYETI